MSLVKKGQMHLRQRRIKREAALSVEKPGTLQENAKMSAKQNKTAEHGEAQHVVAAEAEPEGATTAEGAVTSVANKERAPASRTDQEQGWQQRTRRRATEINRLRNYEIEWLFDSGCTDYIVNDESILRIVLYLKNQTFT